jgi:hypothetical protein
MNTEKLWKGVVDYWKHRKNSHEYWEYCAYIMKEQKKFLSQEECDKIIISNILKEKDIKKGDTVIIEYEDDWLHAGPNLPPKEELVEEIDYVNAEFIFANNKRYPIFDRLYSKKETILDKFNKKLKESDYIIYEGFAIKREYIFVAGNIWSFTKSYFSTEKTVNIDVEKEKDSIIFVYEAKPL